MRLQPIDFEGKYFGKRVLLTGHTGFKGAWLAHWLTRAGAHVTGLALAPEPGRPSLFEEARVAEAVTSRLGDIRDPAVVEAAFAESKPEIVFHLAAQALVRRSYAEPVGTFASNVMGTAHVLEAARRCPSVRAVVCVTTDKVYEPKNWIWGFRENDQLGGQDPYSASKAACEMVASAWQSLYAADGRVKLSTARGGNVIGGGDWSEDRIVVDIVQAVERGAPIVLRNPSAVRPWQHVLELCRGYMMLGARLLDADASAVGAWNFGPGRGNEITVLELTRGLLKAMGADQAAIEVHASGLAETNFLRLDASKAHSLLGWVPKLDLDETISWTANWYRRRGADPAAARALVLEQIAQYRDKGGQ